jgi:hypothetical protein
MDVVINTCGHHPRKSRQLNTQTLGRTAYRNIIFLSKLKAQETAQV